MKGKSHYIVSLILGLTFLFVIMTSICFAEDPLAVQALVEKQEVTVGEAFLMQIKIEGDDSPAEPDLSGLADFTVEPRGGGQNNRESISIINGKINRVSEHGYVFQYLLTPKREGILTIPAIEITAGGKTLLTQPIPVRVNKPVVTDEFKLRMHLSATEGYVGQPLVLTVKWYVNHNIAEFKFDLPFLEDSRFTFADLQADSSYQGQDALQVSLPGGTVIARKGQEGQFATVTLRKVVIPREPGLYDLGRGAAYSKIITGYQQKRGSQPFNDFFNDVLRRRQAVYKQLVTESNDLKLTVQPLPAENRPADFRGLVGQYSLAAEASPTEVNVGDPITLNIMVTGTEFMDNVVLPDLNNQPAIRDNFKVPEEMGPGEVDGRVKTFTQTVRAKHQSVNEIPAIRLSYFNPETRKYEYAESNVIPLTVSATKIITAKDAEGNVTAVTKKELTSLDKGIAHNYVGEDILKNQHIEMASWFASPVGLLLIILPPCLYFLVLVPVLLRRQRLQNGDVLTARKALSQLSKEIAGLRNGTAQYVPQQTVNGLLEAMRAYLVKRMFLPPGRLVHGDVADRLQQQGVDDELIAELKRILDWCEAYHYGAMGLSGGSRENIREKLDSALSLFCKIDQCLK